MNKRTLSTFLVGCGILLILASAALVGYNIWDDIRARNEADSVLSQLGELTLSPDAQAIPDYILNPEMDMPTVEIDGYRYIGTVSASSIGLELPVMETWDYTRMTIAPCRYSGSAYLNNMIICGHNYVSHLGSLRNLKIGDTVTFTDVDGNVFNYEVVQKETLSATAVEEMQSGEWDLTLFTCTVGGQTRVTVRCMLKKNY
ncbi:MAG: sortase [Eubacterium sp.]|nr:sortase [Eubacterium sp.]